MEDPSNLVEGLFAAEVVGTIQVVAARGKGGGKVERFTVELFREDLLLVLMITVAAVHL